MYIKRITLEGIDGGEQHKTLPFPANLLGLDNGTILKAVQAYPWFGMECGRQFPISWDGFMVRAGGLSWSITQLEEEIQSGLWEVVK